MQFFSVDFPDGEWHGNSISYFINTAVFYQQITVELTPFIYNRNILYQVILHILNRNRNHLMMQFIKTVARLLIILILPCFGYSQSTYLPQGSQYEHFLDRIGIKMQSNPDLNIFTCKPISRKVAVEAGEYEDSLSSLYPDAVAYHLGKTDQAMYQSLLMNNSEWTKQTPDSFLSKHPIWNTIYKTPAN